MLPITFFEKAITVAVNVFILCLAGFQFYFLSDFVCNRIDWKFLPTSASLDKQEPSGQRVGGQMRQIAIAGQVSTANNVKYVR